MQDLSGEPLPLFRGTAPKAPSWNHVDAWMSAVHESLIEADEEETPPLHSWGYWTSKGLACNKKKCRKGKYVSNVDARCRLCFIDWPHEECPPLRCDICGRKIDSYQRNEIAIGDEVWTRGDRSYLVPNGGSVRPGGYAINLTVDTIHEDYVWGDIGPCKIKVLIEDLYGFPEDVPQG